MDNPNISMEEYIRLEEEKARRHAIVFNDELSSIKTLSCEPTVSPLNNKEIDLRLSFDESNDEDYTVVFDKNSFSYKIISVNDLKMDSENDNEKVNMPSFLSPEPKDETSLSEYDEVEQDILYFNDIFHFNIIYPDDLKSGKDSDDNKIDIIQSSGGNENKQRSNKLLEASHDKINKIFNVESFTMKIKVNIVTWNYVVNGMLLNLIKNLYVPFGIPFDPKWYYKDGIYTRMLRRPRFEEGLHTTEEIETIGFSLYWVESGRQISNKGDLSTYWREISFEGDFLGIPPSYTIIRDPMLRLCQWLNACSIVGRSQETEKVFEVVRFREEARCDDIRCSVCCPSGREFWVIYGGEALGIDGDCARPPSSRPERQPNASAGTPEAAEDALYKIIHRHMKLNITVEGISLIPTLNMALPPRDQRHPYLRFEGLYYTDTDIADFKERLGTEFGEVVLDLDITGALQFQSGRAESVRQIPDKEDLSAYWIRISSVGYFLGTTPSYTSIRDLMLRLCHMLITCSIARRGQAPEKVFEVIRIGDEARCDDIWGATAGTPEAAEDAPVANKGTPAIPAPVQAP
ncbi:hypothetical protein Tco_0641951 [Tanacetum coccineum]